MRAPGLSHIPQQTRRDMLRLYEKVVNLDYSADSWFSTSTSNCAEIKTVPGEYSQNWKDNGFRTVFDFITRKRPNPAQDLRVERFIQYNKRVTNIDYTSSETRQLRIRTADGALYNANHVIVTVPIGVLKANHATMFTPRLPAWKINSIDHIQFGTLDKIGLEFTTPFWASNWTGFALVWTEQGLSRVVGTRFDW